MTAEPLAADPGAVTRDRILDAAEARFAAVGFRSASVREITQDAGCNLAAVNYHFGSKGNLYREVFRRRLGELRHQRIASLRSGPASRDLEELVRRFAGAFLLPLVGEAAGRRWVELVAQELRDPQLPPELFLDEMVGPVESALAASLASARPGLSAAAARRAAQLLLGQLVHMVNLERCWRRAGDAPADPAAMLEEIVRFTVGGVERLASAPVGAAAVAGFEREGGRRS